MSRRRPQQPPLTPKDINRRNEEFWQAESKFFLKRIERRPNDLEDALGALAAKAADGQFRQAETIESYVAKRAPKRETLGLIGGHAKTVRYQEAHQYFLNLYATWLDDPTQYGDIADFSKDAASRIQAHCDASVKPSTVRQWLKIGKLRRPRNRVSRGGGPENPIQ